MSRIGKQPVPIPNGVEVQYSSGTLKVKGPKGTLEFQHHALVQVELDLPGKILRVNRPQDDRLSRSLHGLTRTLIANMVHGVTQGYEKRLKIGGVGFNARLDGKKVVLTVGFAKPVELTPPAGVTVEVDKDGTTITVKGADKQIVGQFAAEIRSKKKPAPYEYKSLGKSGIPKGIRYDGEVVPLKQGKDFASG
ncbi:50S ribosomal protein L6 [Tuwongella immobilis]|uniref:50S ribosomal protein L6 n=1 Tax=Tuwongella immobilis TaxID=692036 RepID=A0A6C2YP94_9BACT|nr:50S ribosomal protein L6 [Tuwongella immobilis]VIP02702.1 50s ribosomal protein l6 : 50S ribosomal protein L6 OS=Sphaerobacter thermophilus (strain DSM 20745 / S 6022) GN=rplF PE=3 SV=1: Ribosomal_L6: Ribosomal_L6 [Tuwongella immobilis]VTS02195.1 50s ribosomal protein l6 : 50S ribosomal protein L6 OS=Sphaerobacter thermophilus (strain DSM 20745 / S 6022) GN=rplF PE=3 SV=1: Ribosomal_L6: Ribosomal_L6 [Tuwongella immobilis]